MGNEDGEIGNASQPGPSAAAPVHPLVMFMASCSACQPSKPDRGAATAPTGDRSIALFATGPTSGAEKPIFRPTDLELVSQDGKADEFSLSRWQAQGDAVMTDALPAHSTRPQHALLTALFSAAHVQFSFAGDLIEAVGDVLRDMAPAGDRAAIAQALVTRFRERTEHAITELQRISDELCDNEPAAAPPPRAQAPVDGHGGC